MQKVVSKYLFIGFALVLLIGISSFIVINHQENKLSEAEKRIDFSSCEIGLDSPKFGLNIHEDISKEEIRFSNYTALLVRGCLNG